jgi:hypothetical protein
MQEIFPSLLDSMYVEIMFSMTPPTVKESYDSINRKTIGKPVDKNESFKDQIRNDLIRFKKDSTTITIVLNDTIHPLFNEDKLKFQSKYPLSFEHSDENSFARGYKIDLNAYNLNSVFKLVLASAYNNNRNLEPSFEIVLKELSFSRIVFNKERNRGILTCEYVCGTLCGNGYRVFIKKLKGKWHIDYIDHSWIA